MASGEWVRALRGGGLVAAGGLVLAMNAAGTGALAERAQPPSPALAPSLSTPMTSPAGSLASTIGADNTAISPDGRLVTPAGRTIVTDAFSNNVVLSRDGTRIYTSSEAVSNDPQNDKGNTRHFSVIDPQTLNRVRIRDDDIQYGLAETPDGKQLYVSEAGKNSVGVFDTAGFNKLASIALGSRDFPWGLAIHPGGRYAYAVGYRSNTLDVIDTQTRAMIGQPGTGEHPYGVVISPDGKRAYVSNWGLYNAELHNPLAKQAGVSLPPVTPLGYNGNQQSSIWIYDLTNPAAPAATTKINIGAQVDHYAVLSGSLPSGMALSPDSKTLAVTASNHDLLVLIDAFTGSAINSIDMRVFGANGPTGAMPDAAAWSPDGKLIYVAEGGLNAVAVVDAQKGVILGHIPTGWYPAAVAVSPDGGHLYISSDKGLGFGPNGVDHPDGSNYATNKRLVGGTFQDVPLTCLNLRVTTSYVRRDNGFFPSAPEADSSSDGDGGVIPAAFGTPSSKIKHVVMILKENRTFDQILGDMPGVERDQRLADLGGKITPNHHAIARRYATGDNMYHIVLDSTDGHWVSGTGQENEFDLRVDPSEINGVFHGGDQISGTAPENEPIGGMIWNHYKRKNISFKIWGEGLYLAGLQTTNPALSAPNPDPNDPNSLLPISNPATDLENPVQYPTQVPNGTNGDSDEKRADDYVNNSIPLMEKAGMPQFSLVYLPNDHTNGFSSGSLTPSSWVAINDHALGRVIEGLSKSTLWKDTAVFVVEDDTQGGRDHVDAERVLSLTAGPYVRQGYISHVHHSIYSILKTMDLVLGVPPTSVQEASATSMADYFTSSPDNKAPYDAVPYEIDPTVKNQAAVATGDPNFIQAAALQTMVPAGAIDYGPITRQIQVLFHQGEVATHFEYVADTSPVQEHTLTHGVPPVVSRAAFSCDGGGGAAGDSEGALAAVTAVGRELPFTAASSPLTLALLGSAGLGIGLGLEAARRRRRRRRA